eukprot:117645_1
MEIDNEKKETDNEVITELERIEDDVENLLRNVHSIMISLSQLDSSKEDEIKQSISEYHQLLQSIESSLSKQINQCREPLLLPLLPIGHKNQYISNDGRDIHKNVFSESKHNKKQNKWKRLA